MLPRALWTGATSVAPKPSLFWVGSTTFLLPQGSLAVLSGAKTLDSHFLTTKSLIDGPKEEAEVLWSATWRYWSVLDCGSVNPCSREGKQLTANMGEKKEVFSSQTRSSKQLSMWLQKKLVPASVRQCEGLGMSSQAQTSPILSLTMEDLFPGEKNPKQTKTEPHPCFLWGA